MLTALCAAAILAAVLIHFFIVELPRRREAFRRAPFDDVVRRSQALDVLPRGVFLQPTFTWGLLTEEGDVVLGVHPLLLALVGSPAHFTLLREGKEMEKGDVLLSIHRGERVLRVPSPLSGRIMEANDDTLIPDRVWEGSRRPRRTWFYRIRPCCLEEEVPGWFLGSRAVEWTREQYERVGRYLARALSREEVGEDVARGKVLPVGILKDVDDAAWDEFQAAFLSDSTSVTGTGKPPPA